MILIKRKWEQEGEIDELAKNVPSPSVKSPPPPPPPPVLGGCVLGGGAELDVVVGC